MKDIVWVLDFSDINAQLAKYFNNDKIIVDPTIVGLCKNASGEYALLYDDLEMIFTDVLLSDLNNEEFDSGEVDVAIEFEVPLMNVVTGMLIKIYTVPLNSVIDAPFDKMTVSEFITDANEKMTIKFLTWLNT